MTIAPRGGASETIDLLHIVMVSDRATILGVIEHIRDELQIPILYVSHDLAGADRLASNLIEID